VAAPARTQVTPARRDEAGRAKMSIWVLLLQGVGTGSVYALIGMSLNVIYGATSIL